MRKELTLLSTLAFAWATSLGACAGPDVLVGANAGKGGSAGAGLDASGSGGSSAAATGGVGAGATDGGESVTYYLNQIRFDPAATSDTSIKCLPRPLTPDASGAAPCEVYPVVPLANGTACSCDAPGLTGPIEGAARDSVAEYLRANGICGGAGQLSCEAECICQLPQADGDELSACQSGRTPTDSSGWCYVAPNEGLGDSGAVTTCDATHQQALVFYGPARSPDYLTIIACALSSPAPPVLAPLGASCLLSDEYRPTFNGYAITEVDIDDRSPICASGVCISNHFQGRVSCPYGQSSDQLSDPRCFLPGSNTPVTVPVDPQLVALPAAEHVICSCRCDGPGAGPFCTCAAGMECAPLVGDFGLPGDDSLVGSYCIPKGTAYDPLGTIPPNGCDASLMNCGDPRPY